MKIKLPHANALANLHNLYTNNFNIQKDILAKFDVQEIHAELEELNLNFTENNRYWEKSFEKFMSCNLA